MGASAKTGRDNIYVGGCWTLRMMLFKESRPLHKASTRSSNLKLRSTRSPLKVSDYECIYYPEAVVSSTGTNKCLIYPCLPPNCFPPLIKHSSFSPGQDLGFIVGSKFLSIRRKIPRLSTVLPWHSALFHCTLRDDPILQS